MSRNVRFLGPDLHRWVDRTKEDAKYGIAEEALEKASDNAPHLTGFLADQGYAFVDGDLYKQTKSSEPTDYRRVPIPPEGNYENDVTIVFRAGRVSHIGQKIFDYAYYIGVKNPNWLNHANTRFWIETALHPANDDIWMEITKSFNKNWKLLKRG